MEENPLPEAPPPRRLPRLYDEEAAREILEIALGFQGRNFTSGDLEEMAADLGITPTQLTLAEREWERRRGFQAEDVKRAQFLHECRREFAQKVIRWTLLAVTCVVMVMVSVDCLAVVALLLGLFLLGRIPDLITAANHAYFQTVGKEFDEAFDEWLERKSQRHERHMNDAY